MFETILSKDSTHSDARYNLAVALLFQEQTDEAIVQLETVLDMDPDFEPAMELLTQIDLIIDQME